MISHNFVTHKLVTQLKKDYFWRMELPFQFGKVIEDDFFVNRKDEIAHIKNLIHSKLNVTLISPRRWGKSSLVLKIGREMEKQNKNIRFCYIDLFATRSEEEFYTYFATQVLKASYSKWEERFEGAKKFFKQIMPQFSFGLDPQEQFSVSFEWENLKKSREEILNLPQLISEEKNIQLVICLDEFQNIEYFDDPLAFQKRLRAAWQLHQNCSYMLYGSKRHMMSELFENKSMPFYKFGEVLFLSKIANTHWSKYIIRKFKKGGKKISAKNAAHLANLVGNHPYFVQQLGNSVYLQTKEECSRDHIKKGTHLLLEQYDLFFSKEIDSLTNPQLNLLKAIVNDEKQLSSKSTIKAYNLSSSSNVIRIKEALVQKDIIDTFGAEIEILDPLFKLWVKNIYLKK